MNTILKILIGTGMAISLASCGATQDPYGNNNGNTYPGNRTNDGSIYRTNDGQVYRKGEVYRDSKGNVYQNGRIIRTGDVYGQPGILGRNGDRVGIYPTQNRRNLPPGQAKKRYGGEAKDYARGQQKKYQSKKRDWDKDYKEDKAYKKYKKHYKKQNKNRKHDD